MTIITLHELSDYLNEGAEISDVIHMIEMLKEYKSEVEGSIADWQDFIPEVSTDPLMEWGDHDRRKDLKAIVTFLRRKGYNMCLPKLDEDQDGCVWELIKGDKVLSLHWSTITNHFFIAGDRHPRDEQDNPIVLPNCLNWV